MSSCSTLPQKEDPLPAKPTAVEELKTAKLLKKKGKFENSLRLLKKIIKENEGTDVSDDAAVLAGDIYVRLNDPSAAVSYYTQVIDSRYYSPLEIEAIMKSSEQLLKLGRFDEALALTKRGLKYRNLPDKNRLQLYKLRFSILTQLGDRLDAFEALVYLSKNDPNSSNVNAYKVKAQNYLESSLTNEELKRIAGRSKFGTYRAYAYYRLGRQSFEQREFGKAQDQLEEVLSIMPNSSLAEKAERILEQVEARRKVEPKTIGAILPLSGRHEKVARKTLQGLQLGLGIYGKNKSDFRLAVVDSEGNADSARRAVERLVLEDHVIAMVGSLLSRTAVSVASKSNELGVPSIALSQKSGITDVGDYVYRNALTSEMQVEHLVSVSMNKHGMKRFAILYPNDKYGVEYANLFWDHVLANGGQITAVQAYEPKETDFGGHIARMVGKFYLHGRLEEYKLAVKEWLGEQKVLSSRITPPDEILKPIVDFDAIFIPDGTKAVGQIAPMLAYYDIKEVKLLGTNLWNTNSLVTRGQGLVEGALFVDSLMSDDSDYKDSYFYREYQATFGEAPGIFASQGYDAGLLLRQILVTGVRSRVEIRDRLARVVDFPGSLGKMGTNRRREISRPLINLGVLDGQIVMNPKPIEPDDEESSSN